MPGFLDYLYGDTFPFEPPRRVYGRVDRVEPEFVTPSDRWWLVFDCVDADAFDRELGSSATLDIQNLATSVVEFQFPPGIAAPRGLPTDEGEWVEIGLSDSPVGYPLQQFLNLFLAPQNRFLGTADTSTPPVGALEEAVGMNDLSDASDAALARKVAPRSRVAAVSVYDVGQGNWNALLGPDDVPEIYFDLGGGVLGNLHTFPKPLTGLCTTNQPLVVLSHWDWDHWSLAERETSALSLTWIVPRQRLGPVHAQFLRRLLCKGEILVWPEGLESVEMGQVRIEKCTGSAKNRNHSGLAMVVSNGATSQQQTEKVLLPGDCRYTAIPGARDPNLVSVVVPHHGGSLRSSFVPDPLVVPHGRLVYSYGGGNTYEHPCEVTEATHRRKWASERRTSTRPQTPSSEGLGHVHLYWGEHNRDVLLPCGGASCNQQAVQR